MRSSNIAHWQSQAWLRALAFLLVLPFCVHAQGGGRYDATGTGGNHTIQGTIYLPTGQPTGEMIKVKISSTNSSGLSTVADANGAFVFRNLEPGPYYLTVDAGKDFEVYQETLNIDRETSKLGPRTLTLPVYLRVKPNSSLAVGTIDASLAGVPKPALDRYNKGRELAQANNSKAAVEELKAAVTLHADFALAHNELGVQYLKLGQLNQAIETLRTAVKLAPEAFNPCLNYGIALLNKKDFTPAEAQLRQAVKKQDISPTAHMYLGITLISLRLHDEAEKELQRAITLGGNEISLAHYYLGGIYWGKREYQQAANELDTYLKLTPPAPEAERLRTTIKELRSK